MTEAVKSEYMDRKIEIAVFGGGCFWCTEAVFSAGGGSAFGGKMFKGILSVTSGYAGGIKEHPTYEEVSGGKTGHAEVIRIEYDPSRISYHDLLTVFFATHDPSTPNRQGADVGPQYRSIILYTTEEQRRTADEFIRELNESRSEGRPIVTEVKALDRFYEAESYHRDYYARNRENPYCEVVINPKLQKVQEKFAQLLEVSGEA